MRSVSMWSRSMTCKLTTCSEVGLHRGSGRFALVHASFPRPKMTRMMVGCVAIIRACSGRQHTRLVYFPFSFQDKGCMHGSICSRTFGNHTRHVQYSPCLPAKSPSCCGHPITETVEVAKETCSSCMQHTLQRFDTEEVFRDPQGASRQMT